jgi:Protein of unknown function (DUF2800)
MGDSKKHAKYAASAAYRWLSCPGSISLSEKAPSQPESSYALEGTKAHELLEKLLKGEKIAKLKKEYPEEMVEHCLFAWDVISDTISNSSELLCETKIGLYHIHEEMDGTFDAAVIEDFGTLFVFDFKYGTRFVKTEGNQQLLFYALALAHKHHYNFENIEMVIIQPRCDCDEGPVRRWRISIDELKSWNEVFEKGVKACESKNPKFIAGDHCGYCPATVICPEISKKAMQSAQIAFSDNVEPDINSFPEISKIQIKDLGKILNAFEKLEIWMSDVRSHALHCAERGETISEWKLVEKRSIRKWIDGAEKAAQKEFGDLAFKKEFLSPAQLEKAVDARQFLSKYCSSVSSGVTLVCENDKRPAINALEKAFK